MLTTIGENVTIIPAKKKSYPTKVAAYCRVSSEADEQNGSFETQIQY